MPNNSSLPTEGDPRLNLPKPYIWDSKRNTLQVLLDQMTMAWLHKLAADETPPDAEEVYALEEIKNYFQWQPAANFPNSNEIDDIA